MYYQNEPGIYVYTYGKEYYAEWDVFGERKIRAVYYESLDELFRRTGPRTITETFGYSIYDEICLEPVETIWQAGFRNFRYIRRQTLCTKTNCRNHDGPTIGAAVVYDHLCNFYSPDRLVGLYREWSGNRKYYYNWNSWSKRRGGHTFRRFRTFHERKWAHAWDCEEYAPKVRAARQGHNLPDPWDDYHRNSERGWKRCTKRRHQWKEK